MHPGASSIDWWQLHFSFQHCIFTIESLLLTASFDPDCSPFSNLCVISSLAVMKRITQSALSMLVIIIVVSQFQKTTFWTRIMTLEMSVEQYVDLIIFPGQHSWMMRVCNANIDMYYWWLTLLDIRYFLVEGRIGEFSIGKCHKVKTYTKMDVDSSAWND